MNKDEPLMPLHKLKHVYEQHPIGAVLPSMSDDEFEALVRDIKENGQKNPIIMHENKVLDGWHRTRACERLGIPVMSVPFLDKNPVDYVVSHNLRRRHLTASQRALVMAKLGKWRASGRPSSSGTDKGISSEEMAKAAGVSKSLIGSAKKAVKDGRYEKVMSGEEPLAQESTRTKDGIVKFRDDGRAKTEAEILSERHKRINAEIHNELNAAHKEVEMLADKVEMFTVHAPEGERAMIAQLEVKQQEIASLQTRSDIQKTEISDLRKKVARLETENRKLQRQIEELQHERTRY